MREEEQGGDEEDEEEPPSLSYNALRSLEESASLTKALSPHLPSSFLTFPLLSQLLNILNFLAAPVANEERSYMLQYTHPVFRSRNGGRGRRHAKLTARPLCVIMYSSPVVVSPFLIPFRLYLPLHFHSPTFKIPGKEINRGGK